ncbi:MAG: family 16 glycosylhydrolase [Chitinophagaceae bacterium]
MKHIQAFIFFTSAFVTLLACATHKGNKATAIAASTNVYPVSDSMNAGKWVLNTAVSDEFNNLNLDTTKWFVQGTNSVYRSNFKGHAPAHFSTHNVRLENGMLKLQTRWEPDFNFSKQVDPKGAKYENITTAAIISKKPFLHGYMEIKCKGADASITSSFWATGSKTELDIFESLGKPTLPNKKHLETEFWSSVHDWSKNDGPSVWTNRHQLPFRMAEGFHVYGCEWDKDYLNFYADGKLIKSVTRIEMGAGWVITNP